MDDSTSENLELQDAGAGAEYNPGTHPSAVKDPGPSTRHPLLSGILGSFSYHYYTTVR